MPLLELKDVGARYGGVPALEGVSLTLADAEIVALLGAGGAGKTTLLRAVLGTVKTTGEVHLDGERLYHRTPEGMARRGVHHVAARGGIFGELSVLDNLRLGAWTQRGLSPRDLAHVYEAFPVLYDRRNRSARSLDAGEQRLLALGRAMMAKPRLLLADEPSLGVDPTVVRDVFAALHTLNQRGAAILLVDQHRALAAGLAARTLALDAGRPVAQAALGY